MTLARPVPLDLRQWRKRHGLTQHRAADVVGVHERTWRKWENEERRIPRMLTLLVNDQPQGGEV